MDANAPTYQRLEELRQEKARIKERIAVINVELSLEISNGGFGGALYFSRIIQELQELSRVISLEIWGMESPPICEYCKGELHRWNFYSLATLKDSPSFCSKECLRAWLSEAGRE